MTTGSEYRMGSIYGLAWRNLAANRVRSALMVLAVCLGVAVTIAGSLLTESVRAGVLQSEELETVMAGVIDIMDPMMLFSGVAVMLASGFLIFNAFGMAITRQRQQIGGLRALGMTRRQILRVVLAEAMILAVIGVIGGLLLSAVIGQGLIEFMKTTGGDMLAFGDANPTPAIVIFAVVMGLLITVGSVLVPARRAARTAPLDALRAPEASGEETVDPRRTGLGTILALGVLSYVLIAPPGAWISYPLDLPLTIGLGGLWLLAVILLLPALVRRGAWLATQLLPGSTTRFITDNLRRAQGRVSLTVLSLMLALMVLVGFTGFMTFFMTFGFRPSMESAANSGAFFMSRIDIVAGLGATIERDMDSVMMADDESAAIQQVLGDRATGAAIYSVMVPELSFMGSSYFNYVVDPDVMVAMDTALFNFVEGDWETALPIMEAGCGVLVAPAVASRHGVEIGDTLTVTGINGPVDCTLAGLGSSVGNASVISGVVRDQFTTFDPLMILIRPNPGVDGLALTDELWALQADYPYLTLTFVEEYLVAMDESINVLTVTLNLMLLLATFAAAFSVVNTMLISIEERRREIGLLRAVGTTRKQTQRILVGEAAFMGLIGGAVGFAAGIGVVVIVVLTYGLTSFGVERDLYETAVACVESTLLTGIVGMLAAPLIAAAAAWLPARRVLQEKPVTSLALR